MNPIVRCSEGTYVDLSRIVAISPVEKLRGDYTEVRQFDIYFLPEGIPFKQDQSFSVTISKEYQRPKNLEFEKDEHGHIKHPCRLTDNGIKVFDEFKKKITDEVESSRTELANLWTNYKNTTLK